MHSRIRYWSSADYHGCMYCSWSFFNSVFWPGLISKFSRSKLSITSSSVPLASNSACLSCFSVISPFSTRLSPSSFFWAIEGYINRLSKGDDSAYSVLTRREREVLQLIAEGKSTKVIAKELCVSAKTVEWHHSQLMKKLGVQSIAELVKYAINEGLTRSYA